MLYGVEVCEIGQNELVKTQMDLTRNMLQSGSEYVIGTFFSLLNANPNLGVNFATSALSLFIDNEIADDEYWETHYSQLALYGLTMSGVVYVYETEKGTLSMHTSSIRLLDELVSQDKIELPSGKTIQTEMNRWEKQLSLARKGAIHKSLEEGNVIRTVRLELQPNGKYSVTIPRSCVNFEECPIIPSRVLAQELANLVALSKNQLLKITMGDKVRFVTLSKEVLGKVYDSQRVDSLLKSFSVMRSGDSYVYLPSVGASKYTPGLTRIDLINISYVQGGNLSEVDLSQVNLNYDMTKSFLIGYLKESTVKPVAKALGIPVELLQGKNVTEQKDYLTATIMRMNDSDVYSVILSLGITPQELDSYDSPIGKNYEEVAIPSSAGELLARLATGVYKLVYIKRDGKFGTLIGTNCDKNLKSIYGANYMRKFESEGVRLRKLMNSVMKKDTLEKSTFINMCDKLGLDIIKSEVSSTFMLSDQLSSESLVGIISKYLQAVESRRTTKPSSDNVLVRNCFATVENGQTNNFYRNIDFKSIKAIYKLTE